MASAIWFSVRPYHLYFSSFEISATSLGAMGCGAYWCPPHAVAREMKAILLEPEFKGWFKKVVFAVYSSPGNGEKNFNIFSEIFENVKV